MGTRTTKRAARSAPRLRGGYGSVRVSGVPIVGVVAGGPAAAAKAGLTAGDGITSVDGYSVTSQPARQQVLTASLSPGMTVTVQYTATAGQQHSVAITLVAGPAA
jgi:S1-C subfamily serine protease